MGDLNILSGMSISDLKKMHKSIREKIICAKDARLPDDNIYKLIKPNFNPVRAESFIVLRELDKELDERGYNVEKLFKGYNKEDFANTYSIA